MVDWAQSTNLLTQKINALQRNYDEDDSDDNENDDDGGGGDDDDVMTQKSSIPS